MPTIIIRAVRPGVDHQITLSERLLAGNLDSDHYSSQLLDRIRWAVADAEALESPRRADAPEPELRLVGVRVRKVAPAGDPESADLAGARASI
jgi:hypothetical protein